MFNFALDLLRLTFLDNLEKASRFSTAQFGQHLLLTEEAQALPALLRRLLNLDHALRLFVQLILEE